MRSPYLVVFGHPPTTDRRKPWSQVRAFFHLGAFKGPS